jgi:hypothetical protein
MYGGGGGGENKYRSELFFPLKWPLYSENVNNSMLILKMSKSLCDKMPS